MIKLEDTLKDGTDNMLFRGMALPFVRISYKLGLTANQLTAIDISFVVVASALIAMNLWLPLAGVLIIFFAIFDHVDGAIARLNNSVSIHGRWLANNAHAAFAISTRIGLSLWLGFSSPIAILFSMLMFIEIFFSWTFSLTYDRVMLKYPQGKAKAKKFIPNPKRFRRRPPYIFSEEFMNILFLVSMFITPWLIILYFTIPKNMKMVHKFFAISRRLKG